MRGKPVPSFKEYLAEVDKDKKFGTRKYDVKTKWMENLKAKMS